MNRFIAILSLLPALLLSQMPEFVQQYRQRLGGAIDELRPIVQHFDEDSRRSGYDRVGALDIMQKNPERLVRDQGARMKETIARLSRLEDQQLTLKDGASLSGFLAFAANYDKPLFEKTRSEFAPALQLTFWGLVFAVFGWTVSYALLVGAAFFLRILLPDRRSSAFLQ